MIFERLTLHNFQRYHGTSSIDFPDPTESKSIVLILAPNNSGKTTVLRALEFLLYGNLHGYSNHTIWNLANSHARKSTPEGGNLSVWVEARIKIGNNEPVTIRREFSVRQNGPERWMAEGPYLLSKQYDQPTAQFIPEADGSLQSQIEADVPIDLFSWFYFAGEPASGRMSSSNSTALTEPLKKAIQLRRWSDAISTAKETLNNLRKQLKKESESHGAYAELSRRRDVVTRSKESNQESLIEVENRLEDLKTEFQKLDAECSRTSKKAEESQELYQRLKDQEQKRDRAKDVLDRIEKEIGLIIAKSAGLPLLEPGLPEIAKRLQKLREANLLPADISKGFIERLLASAQCVCGRFHDEGARKHLESYLEQTLASHTNNDLVNLANALEGGESSRLNTLINAYPQEFHNLSGRKADAIRNLQQAEEAIADLKPRVESSSIQAFNLLVRQRNEVASKISVNENESQELIRSIKTQDNTLQTLREQLAKARPKRGADKLTKLEGAIKIAENLVENLREGQQCFQNTVYDLLQERLSTHFDPAVSGDNRAKLDRQTLLPMIIDSAGNTIKNAGGGETQVLSIAFVVSLAELRSQINNDMKEIGLAGRLLGEQSFILDSPFTSADHNYMRAIADFLPNKAPQLLVLLAKQNWPDTVREALEPHIASAYGITLHTSAEAHDPTSFEFEINGKSVCLREEIADDEESYTTFNKI